MVTTEGRLLGGRVTYLQLSNGFRSGIEPLLLAAAVPVREGEHVVEGGAGAGAALLCLHARMPGVRTTGIEVDQTLVELATMNAVANGFAGMQVIAGRVESTALTPGVDHAIANPPYHGPGTASARSGRETAKRGSDALVHAWVAALGSHLRDKGSLTLILPAGMLPICLAAMSTARCGCRVVFPLWPKVGRSARLVLVQGAKGSRAPMRLSPGLVLHNADGTFTPAAQAILRDGTALALD